MGFRVKGVWFTVWGSEPRSPCQSSSYAVALQPQLQVHYSNDSVGGFKPCCLGTWTLRESFLEWCYLPRVSEYSKICSQGICQVLPDEMWPYELQ